jgi:membrane-associated protease RseP (regulator of RpoE activity)
LAAEAVRGKALSFNARMRLSQVGFVIVVGIMVWAVANDLLRVFGL